MSSRRCWARTPARRRSSPSCSTLSTTGGGGGGCGVRRAAANETRDCSFAHDDFNAQLEPFLASLASFEPHVRALVAASSDDAALSERLDEACVNLRAFVDYKRQQRRA